MNLWNKILGRPYLMLAFGAVLGGGVIAANNFKPGSSPIAIGSVPLQFKPASFPGSSAMATARDIDAAMASLAEASSAAVVNVRDSKDGKGAQGSGFIYTSDGWIITNDHVVSNAKVVYVTLSDGREFEGKVTRANDGQIDLAVVKIDAKDLPTLSVADSNGVRPGQTALAIGSPFGLQNSVTIGHISAVERAGDTVLDPRGGARAYTGMLQTDTSINPGNSGGPLLNIDGQVVGVNSTIYSMSGSNSGIGFSIASNVVKAVADKMIRNGKFERGFLGAELTDVKPFKQKELGIKGGALVARLSPSSPATRAGLASGDIITAVNGKVAANQLDVRVELYKKNPGDTVTLTYMHDGKVATSTAKLGKIPEAAPMPQQDMPRRRIQDLFPDMNRNAPGPEFFPPEGRQRPSAPRAARPQLGVQIQSLDDNSRKMFNIPADATGVVVDLVEPGSFAEKIGMQPGDVISNINGKDIQSADGVRAEISKLAWGDTITLSFGRYENGSVSRQTVTVPFN